ncbi:MAG: hypothetical protein A2X08_06045 [Bacteroidetes bacterium GWA2_32_17]|nr:MAG: hypothetical protein A2X08_06045 [Bacteroidetes bacterium GWA2_32_17]
MEVCFLGDISLNNGYNSYWKNSINPFSEIEKELNGDFVIGNLECMAEGSQGINVKKMPRLSTEISTLSFLNTIRLSVAQLAHNHAYDNLEDGFNNTLAFLKNNNIQQIGAGRNNEEASNTIILKKNDISIGLINYVHKDTNPWLPDDCPVFLNIYNKEKILDQINKLIGQVDHIILLFHWGGKHEEAFYPVSYQIKDAHQFIDAGADLIVGGHSHTLQPFENYKGKHIIYGLGNFCFDDVVCEGRIFSIGRKRKRESAILTVEFEKKHYAVNYTYIQNDHGIIRKNKKVISKKHKRRNRFFKIYKQSTFIRKIYSVYFKYFTPIYLFIFDNNESLKSKIKRFSIKKIIKHFTR